jgi:hypothetical protein
MTSPRIHRRFSHEERDEIIRFNRQRDVWEMESQKDAYMVRGVRRRRKEEMHCRKIPMWCARRVRKMSIW